MSVKLVLHPVSCCQPVAFRKLFRFRSAPLGQVRLAVYSLQVALGVVFLRSLAQGVSRSIISDH